MMNHYYTDNTDLESQRSIVPFEYRGIKLEFISDLGVFSKQRIDYGSMVLLDTISISKQQVNLLDVGCGYGTLGVSLKKVYNHLVVDMIDVNNRAIQLAKESAKKNDVEVNVFESYIYDNIIKTYDVIVSNPPIRAGKKVVMSILEGAYDRLNSSGELYIVIQKKQGAPSAKKKMEEVFGNCEILKRDKGYYILRSIK